MVLKKKGIEIYTMRSMATFKGFIKNGLDSSTMINIIAVFDSEFEEFKNLGYEFPPNLFFYHDISWTETIGVLINEHNFTKEEAKEGLNKLIKKFNLQKITRFDSDEYFEEIVEKANKRVVDKFKNTRLEIGDNDIIIIAGFMREKINFIHSGDEEFLKTCEELGLHIVPMLERDMKKEQEIKKYMKKRKNQ